jgi:glutamate 5-kinase
LTVKRLVVKVGTSTVTHDTGKLNLHRLELLVRQVTDLTNAGVEVALVSSGAVGAGLGRLGWQRRPATIPEKQAVAAVGQSLLMQVYEKLFAE